LAIKSLSPPQRCLRGRRKKGSPEAKIALVVGGDSKSFETRSRSEGERGEKRKCVFDKMANSNHEGRRGIYITAEGKREEKKSGHVDRDAALDSILIRFPPEKRERKRKERGGGSGVCMQPSTTTHLYNPPLWKRRKKKRKKKEGIASIDLPPPLRPSLLFEKGRKGGTGPGCSPSMPCLVPLSDKKKEREGKDHQL